MNILSCHSQIVSDYESYIKSFLNIADDNIREKVESELSEGKLWPDPLLQFNPSFELAETLESLTAKGLLHSSLKDFFPQGMRLFKHQVEAIQVGTSGKGFVVTSGTGSGKSLTYIGTIFHHLLSNPDAKGVVAVVVYPMNALINSQFEEFSRYKENYERSTGRSFPITFGQYTGQEKEDQRDKMRENPPQILLTNYMMLELLLTRLRERPLRDAIFENLRFLVFDELHTYRGRQGADVALLIRRIRSRCNHSPICIGTSATLVSEGSFAERLDAVVALASKIFGTQFGRGQIISETLVRSISGEPEMATPTVLTTSLREAIDPHGEVEQLVRHPLAHWLEDQIALEEIEGRLFRAQPGRISDIVEQLSAYSGLDESICLSRLNEMLQWISAANQRQQETGNRYTYLPFKLHQFISQTGSVYTTLDQDQDRFITLEPGVFKTDEEEKKPIFPNVFSRTSGHAFICVSKVGDRLVPREFRELTEEAEADEDTEDGYLIVGEDIWNSEEDMELLPEAWVRTTKTGLAPRSEKKHLMPRKLHFDEYGNCSETKEKRWWGWFMSVPLLFDPTSGTFYDTKTNEGTKLTKLGSEGRSTSTTILSFSIINQLADAGMPIHDQKLLSFTDNRQDAALQAGHFNDFVQVVRLRSGIRKALENAPDGQLDYRDLGEAIAAALNLPFLEYANRNEEPTIETVRRKFASALRDFLVYRAIHDLRRSWRVILPNLEQCALLRIEYVDFDILCEDDAFWSEVPIVGNLELQDRKDFLLAILDFFRLEYAIYSENYLTSSKIQSFDKLFRETLRSPWTLDRNERLEEPYFIRLDPLNRRARLHTKSMGPASGLGRFIKLFAKLREIEYEWRGDGYRSFILQLAAKLEEADFLKSQTARNGENQEVPIYQLRLDRIIWRFGDRELVRPDQIKQRSYKGRSVRPNLFFQRLYSRNFVATKSIRGEDHTGQLNTDTRISREERFRADWFLDEAKQNRDIVRTQREMLSALFCSPTMELGIDIGGLSVVHMRNAPPNPANYAQRAGRSGRSGQGALVFTYCSSYSPHDRHFFANQQDLVAGAVRAPKLDLLNEELVATHLNAVVASEVGIPGIEDAGGLRPSILNLVDDDGRQYSLSSATRAGLQVSDEMRSRIRDSFKRAISDFEADLRGLDYAWFTDTWIEERISRITDHLDSTLDRWRVLYRSAREILTRATQRIESGTLNAGSDEYRKQKRNQDQATRQLDLLRNDTHLRRTELSEFYPYRYLAAEGFLPGYNFTRLPVRIFIPTSESSGEFISRPRSIAMREFGPRNVIYHSGRKYQVAQLVVQDAESALSEAKVSKKVGYFLDSTQRDSERCPISGLDLSDTANCEHLHDLMEMAESRAVETDRISCQEEERVSRGFDIQTYFTIDGGDTARIQKAVLRSDENQLLNIRYIPAARLIHVNRKWRSNQSQGFPLGLVTGDWKTSMPDPSEEHAENYRLVKLWTSNLADALYLEPIQPLGLDPDGVITLQHALKRGIELCFDVESNEVGVVTVGASDSPNILIYEASEGSLGILSRFVKDVNVFRDVIACATSICRFEDAEYRGPASYDDLLSYFNQRDHKIINRFLIQDALKKLSESYLEIQSSSSFANYEEQYQFLLRNLDPNSSTEREFIEHLYRNNLRLPDAAQKRVDGIYVQPDFYYEPRFWVFCDGTPHDEPAVAQDDREKRDAIMAIGDEVWSWHYRDNLADRIALRPDIFRRIR